MQNRAPENQVPRDFQESFLTHAKTTSHLHYTLKPRPFPKILMPNTMSDRALILLSFLDFLARAKAVAGPTDMIFLILFLWEIESRGTTKLIYGPISKQGYRVLRKRGSYTRLTIRILSRTA